jgi:hypothetical protein
MLQPNAPCRFDRRHSAFRMSLRPTGNLFGRCTSTVRNRSLAPHPHPSATIARRRPNIARSHTETRTRVRRRRRRRRRRAQHINFAGGISRPNEGGPEGCKKSLLPCTPLAIVKLMEYLKVCDDQPCETKQRNSRSHKRMKCLQFVFDHLMPDSFNTRQLSHSIGTQQ